MQTLVDLSMLNAFFSTTVSFLPFHLETSVLVITALSLVIASVLHYQSMSHQMTLQVVSAQRDLPNEESLKSLNYTIGHDLKSPVRNLQRIIERFKAKNTHLLDPDGQQEVEQLSLLIQDAASMLDGILNYSTQDQLDLNLSLFQTQRVLSHLIQGIQEENQDRNLAFHIQELPDQLGDPLMLRQVFDNLLQNAVKFSAQANPAEITIGCTSSTDWNEFFIQDNGIGVPAESSSRIFELFKTAHDRSIFKGTGVGLAIVKRIVERHQGQIWVEPNRPAGSIFKIRLPRNL